MSNVLLKRNGDRSSSDSGEGPRLRNREAAKRLAPVCFYVGLVLLIGAGVDTSQAKDFLDLEEGPSRGSRQAPVVLIEYSDFTCGFCKKFFLETWPRIKATYVQTGKVRFLYRDYPRADRGLGLDAAIAARCAGDQGQYWSMHDRLMGGGRIGEPAFQRHARAIGLDLSAFGKCRGDGRYETDIFRHRAQGVQWGFRGTPGFLLLRLENGQPNFRRYPPAGIPGALPFEVFEEEIERLLALSPASDRG